MWVILNEEGYFLSELLIPDEANTSRDNVIEVPDRTGLTTHFKWVNGNWVDETPPLEPPAEGMSEVSR